MGSSWCELCQDDGDRDRDAITRCPNSYVT
nr:unnamed protein product [Digitaria exilis]